MMAVGTATRLADLKPAELRRLFNEVHARWREARMTVEWAEDEFAERAGKAAMGLLDEAAVAAAEAKLAEARRDLARLDAAMTWLRGQPGVSAQR